jgi:hypothetical protein
MKIYALPVALLLLSPSGTVAEHNMREWIQYENTPACCETFGEHTEGGRRLASDHSNVTSQWLRLVLKKIWPLSEAINV